jgi:transcriptional regulator with XRE-family HTH domain
MRNTHAPLQSRPHSQVRQVLLVRGLTAADLSRLSGVRYQSLICALNGYRPPSLELMRRTAEALSLSTSELWGDEAER